MSSGLTHRVIATAGHVDHGKSTLVRRLTGMEPDRLAEERRRGLSIELGFAWGRPDPRGSVLAFVDVPGHERFIATMLAGAGPSPAALFVVAADDGWSAQSTEHAEALALLDIPVLAVAVTKADTVDEERVTEVTADVARRGAGLTVGDAPVVPVDSLSGRGVDTLVGVLTDGVRELPPPRDVNRPRLWLDRVFTIAGAGTVVTGTLEGGVLEVDDAVRLLPGGRQARVRGLQQLGEPVSSAAPGSRLAVNLAGIDHHRADRGDTLVGAAPWHVSRCILAAIRPLPDREISRVGAWHLHAGTTDIACRLEPLSGDDGPVVARVHLDHPLALVAGDRFVLRDAGRRLITGGGTVIDPISPPRPRRSERRDFVTTVRALSRASPTARITGLAGLSGGQRPRDELLAAAGWPSTAPLPEDLAAIGPWVVTADQRRRWVVAVEALGDGLHTRETVTEAIRRAADTKLRTPTHDLATRAAEHLVATGVLVRRPGGYTLTGRADAADEAVRGRHERFLTELSQRATTPPPLDELAARHGLDHRQVTTLVQQGRIVPLGDFAMSSDAIAQAVDTLARTVAAGGNAFTASAAKEAWGTSRKYAIPLLEHLDRTGVTRFDGQLRILVGSAGQSGQSPTSKS